MQVQLIFVFDYQPNYGIDILLCQGPQAHFTHLPARPHFFPSFMSADRINFLYGFVSLLTKRWLCN